MPVVNAATNPVVVPSPTTTANPPATTQDAKLAGVSFRFNPQIFGSVEPREVAEYRLQEASDVADDVAPRHVKFTFGLKKQYNEAHVTVYPVKEFPPMFDKDIENKKGVIREFRNLNRVLTHPRLRFGGDIPFIPFRNGSQEFQSQVKLAKFENGRGIFFVTHWTTEMALVSNNHLYYVFEGLTDDGKHYVIAEMPVNVSFLPEMEPDEYEGYKESDLYDYYRKNAAAERKYRDYIDSIATRLEALSPGDFQPSLHHLEEIVNTLRIQK